MRWPWRKSKAPKVLAQQPPTCAEKKQVLEKPSLPSPPQDDQPKSVQAQPSQPPPALGSAPLGLDATANEEITAIWAQVQERVRQLAESEGKEVNDGLEIDDVLANLESSQEQPEQSPAAQAVKTAFNRTMGLIKTVGGIVASGASQVFAPAGKCYNVITFLINAYDGYQGAFQGLADLLEKCSDHLARLDYYVKGGMDVRLSKVAAQQLLLFVEICDAALKLRHSASEKIKTGLKIAFLAEDSIQDLLAQMAKLAERERGLVSAQTFQLASAAATSAAEGAGFGKQIVDTLAQNSAAQKERIEKEGQQRTLMDVLAFDKDPDRWDSTKQEPVESWERRFNDIRKNVVPGTGQWLLDNPVFQSWVADFASSPILGVEGTDITGKSYLTSSVIKHLRTHAVTQYPEFRHLVAFFFLDRDKPGHGFDTVAKSLVWQLADKDEPYMKSAARISQEARTLDPGEIIPRLLLENTDLEHMDAIFYLVIDGLGDNLDDALPRFLRQASESPKMKIRIFLTGTPTAFGQIKKSGVACRGIPISRHNHDDIEKCIDAKMDKFEELSDTDSPGIAERRRKIREQLADTVAGDYYKLNSALNAISTLDYMDDINRVIQGARTERSQQIGEEIQMLNRVRSPRQIQEINQIILWITFAVESVSEKLISAILYMTVGEAPLRPLTERFRTKYLLFEVDGKGNVGFRSSKTLNAIPQRRQLHKPRQNDQEIQNGEINMVKHFLEKVCPPDVYKKLEMDEYLQQKLTQKQDQIQQEDNDTGHLLLALDCLRALTRGRDVGIAVLQEYAREHLVKHLSLVDLAMVDREQKSQVGESLVQLFKRNECIDNFMWPDSGGIETHRIPRFVWLEDSQNVAEVVRWLRDTAAVSSVTDESDRSWVKSVVSSNRSFEALLKPSVVRMAYHCLREPSLGKVTGDIYQFVNTFLSKVGIPAEEDDECAIFEKWAHEALQLADKDTLWQTQMARVFEIKSLKEQAIARCDLALQADPNNWRASLCRARNVPPDEAVEILKAVISSQERDSLWMQDPAHLESLASLNFELAKRYWEVGHYDLAIPTFAVSFKQAPRRIDRTMDVLMRYSAVENWTAIVSFIEQLLTIDDMKVVGDMVLRHIDSPKFHLIIEDTAFGTKQFGFADKLYKAAIQKAEKRSDHKALLLARSYYGGLLYNQPNRREDKVLRLLEAALKDDFPASGMDPDVILPQIYVLLGGIYLQRALVAKAEDDPDSVTDYLDRISDMVPEEVTQSRLSLSPQLYLARFHHVDGNDAKAREIVRTLVQVSLELLSDDDEGNDFEAFVKLFYVFIPLNDTKNATAALHLVTLGSRSDNGEGPEYDIGVHCDGCKYRWRVPSEMCVCKNCIAVTLEDNCLKKLREGKLERNLCNQNHDFFQLPKWDDTRMDSLPKGMVPWGDQNITMDEWKQEIRKAYVRLDA